MEEEDTIELIDYLRVVWKWKWMIILVTLGCMITAGVISLKMPEIYNITAMIESGTIGTTKDGELIYFDTPGNIKSRIDGGAYDSKIINALKLNPMKNIPKFKAFIPKGSRIIKITSEYESSKRDLGIKATNQLLKELSEQYQGIIALKRGDLEKRIMLIKSEIGKKNNQIRLFRTNIKINEEQDKFLVKQLKKVRANTEIILRRRDALLDKTTDSYAISALLYSNTIQQNMIYINQLNNQLVSITRKQEDLQKDIEDLEKDIEKSNTEIERLKLEKAFVENIKYIQEPQVSMYPIKPKKRLNVMLAFVIGLMFSVFLAFFLEYLQKMGILCQIF